MNGRQNLYRRTLLATLAVALLGSLAYLLDLVSRARLLERHRRSLTVYHPDPWLILAAAAGALLVIGWAMAERRLSALGAEAESAREAREQAAEARERLREAQVERARIERERDEERAAGSAPRAPATMRANGIASSGRRWRGCRTSVGRSAATTSARWCWS